MTSIILLRGGGDLASGAAARLRRCGLRVLIVELARPLVVRRGAAFAEAVYAGRAGVEELTARCAPDLDAAFDILAAGEIPVLVDPELACLPALRPLALVDGRLAKRPPETGLDAAPLVVGLGPGFIAGGNCHAVVETKRGHALGRVIWEGAAEADTGIPERTAGVGAERVLRAPAAGQLIAHARIGDLLAPGDPVAEVAGQVIVAPFAGALRGLLHAGLPVQPGMKIGDLDPRREPAYCFTFSDKALAVGGGVLEALLARPDIRARLWEPNAPD
jgi:xanthine dehydrogenase accessory factor